MQNYVVIVYTYLSSGVSMCHDQTPDEVVDVDIHHNQIVKLETKVVNAGETNLNINPFRS